MLISWNVHAQQCPGLTRNGANAEKKTFTKLQFCRWKRVINKMGQRRTTRLIRGYKKDMATQISTLYHSGKE